MRRGFTLIELLIVIIIIAVMASIVVPAYVNFADKARFQAKTREIQDLFAYAREQAVTNDTSVTLHFDPQTETFTAMATPNPPPADLPAAFMTAEASDAVAAQSNLAPRIVELSQNERVAQFTTSGGGTSGASGAGQNSLTELHFQGDGTVESAEIRLVDPVGHSSHLILWPSTGKLTLEDDGAQR